MRTTIDRAIDVLSHSPEAGLYSQLIQELMLLKSHGVMENSYGCPAAGCRYVTTIPYFIGSVDHPPVCPRHGCPLVILTAKQMMVLLADTLRRQTAEFQAKVDEVVAHIGRVDDAMFLSANERDELTTWRDLYASPFSKFALRMVQEVNNNAHKGKWEDWKPEWKEIVSEVVHHLEKLGEAIQKNNRTAVSEYAADIGNYMLKTVEMYGA